MTERKSAGSAMAAEQAFRWLVWLVYSAFVLVSYWEMLVGWNRLRQWAYNHEGLASGLLALAAAVIGAVLLQRQITQSERHERSRIASRREAVRTMLPLALSTIVSYATLSGKAAARLMDQCVGENLPEGDLEVPDMPRHPSDALATLKELVEFLDPADVRPFALLVADLQVQASRLSETLASVAHGRRLSVLRINLEQYVLDAAFVYARTSKLFDFARGAANEVPRSILWSDVKSALFFFDMHPEDDEPIARTIMRRSEGNLAAAVAARWAPSQ